MELEQLQGQSPKKAAVLQTTKSRKISDEQLENGKESNTPAKEVGAKFGEQRI